MKLFNVNIAPNAIVVPNVQTALSPIKASDTIIPALPMDDSAIVPALSPEHENALRGLAVSLAEKANDAELLAGATIDAAAMARRDAFRQQYLIVFELSKGEGFNVLGNTPELSTAKYRASQAVRDGAYCAIVFPPAEEFDYSTMTHGSRPMPVYQVTAKNADGVQDMPPRIPAWKREQDRIKAQEKRVAGIVAAKRAPLTAEQKAQREENKVLAAASRRESLLLKAGK